MSHEISVNICPGEALRFPPVCVHCGSAAEKRLPLRRRQGRITRAVDVPLCTACDRELRRLSGEEERLRKIGWLVGGVVALFVFVLLVILLPGRFFSAIRLLPSLALAALSGLAVVRAFQRASVRGARPEKRAILHAARFKRFSWRTATFEFADEQFARKFEALNSSDSGGELAISEDSQPTSARPVPPSATGERLVR